MENNFGSFDVDVMLAIPVKETFDIVSGSMGTICSSQGARKRLRYGHFGIGLLVHSLGFLTLAPIVFRVEAYVLRHAYNCRI